MEAVVGYVNTKRNIIIILVIVLFRSCYDFTGQIEVVMTVIILKDRHRVFASLSCRFSQRT